MKTFEKLQMEMKLAYCKRLYDLRFTLLFSALFLFSLSFITVRTWKKKGRRFVRLRAVCLRPCLFALPSVTGCLFMLLFVTGCLRPCLFALLFATGCLRPCLFALCDWLSVCTFVCDWLCVRLSFRAFVCNWLSVYAFVCDWVSVCIYLFVCAFVCTWLSVCDSCLWMTGLWFCLEHGCLWLSMPNCLGFSSWLCLRLDFCLFSPVRLLSLLSLCKVPVHGSVSSLFSAQSLCLEFC